MDALILVNKPPGISSTKVGTAIKRLSGIRKAGHAGTLDLEASGLLLILLGAACRMQSHLLVFDKVYSGTLRFGIATDTDDLAGKIVSRQDTSALSDPRFRAEAEERIKKAFSGKINQIAPAVSAKKSDGIPDYKRVRRGEVVTPKSKEVEVEVLEFTFLDEHRARYELRVSSGFYVRSFARDAGALIGIQAAAESICRTSIGPLHIDEAINFDDLDAEVFNGSRSGFKSLNEIFDILPYPRTVISDASAIAQVCSGNKQALADLKIDSPYHLVYSDSEPLAIVSRVDTTVSYAYVKPLSQIDTRSTLIYVKS
jgi:tRNA pseudouridine55 synthase